MAFNLLETSRRRPATSAPSIYSSTHPFASLFGSPNAQTSPLVTNPQLGAGFNQAQHSILGREAANRKLLESTIFDLLEPARLRIGEMFTGREESIEQNLPLNPYSDELLETQKNTIFDQIARETSSLMNQAQVNLNSRGLGRSSLGHETSGVIQTGGTQARAASLTDLLQGQFEQNQQSNRFREGLLSQLTTNKAAFEENIARVEAAMRAGEVVDPTTISTLIQDVIDADIALQNQEQTLALANRISGAALSPQSKFFDMLAPILSILFPSSQGLQAAAAGLNALFNPAYQPMRA